MLKNKYRKRKKMGKISVFKFNINNDEKIKNNVNDII